MEKGRGGTGSGDWTRDLFYLRGLEQFLETDSVAANQSVWKRKHHEVWFGRWKRASGRPAKSGMSLHTHKHTQRHWAEHSHSCTHINHFIDPLQYQQLWAPESVVDYTNQCPGPVRATSVTASWCDDVWWCFKCTYSIRSCREKLFWTMQTCFAGAWA